MRNLSLRQLKSLLAISAHRQNRQCCQGVRAFRIGGDNPASPARGRCRAGLVRPHLGRHASHCRRARLHRRRAGYRRAAAAARGPDRGDQGRAQRQPEARRRVDGQIFRATADGGLHEGASGDRHAAFGRQSCGDHRQPEEPRGRRGADGAARAGYPASRRGLRRPSAGHHRAARPSSWLRRATSPRSGSPRRTS